ncbi:MAG: xanthine dehydrogenase family protein molybdopterin-binding subunit [Bradyrhizobiaceae bacterium]|nr:xanthine dehydrogenase family protein molybdopterin-binding subunit [Bradyrhizobiaceae bacterium]
MGEYGIGQPVPREEDPYLVRGAGRYVDDVKADRQAHANVLRSPHAHAHIRHIDVTRAKAMPGVIAVLTGEDAEVLKLGALEPKIPRRRRDGTPAFVASQPFLARGRVRYVGDPVAFIVAETLDEAKDAAEAIEVQYDILPAVATTADAIAPGAVAVWDGCPDNEVFTHAAGDRTAVAKSMTAAVHVVRHRVVINRLTANSMEPRGCIAQYAAREGRYILRCTVQGPHQIRRAVAADVFGIAETRFRIVAENVGGGFGMKGALYPEYVLASLAARLTGRPVKWIGERSESLQSDEHCRDNVSEAALGLDGDGRFLAFSVRSFCNVGAYYTSDRNAGPPTNNIGVLAGTYVIPAIHVETTGVLTNTMMTGPYRGAGRPEAAYVIETMVDLAARKLGIDPAELRRRNMIPPAAMPYKTALIYTYDCGDFGKNLEDGLKLADYAGFDQRRRESATRGKVRGLGISSTVEASNAGLIEHAEIRFDPTGTVTVSVGTHDHGQGHQTTFRQIISDRLGIPPGHIRFNWGDTDQIAIGTGTFGSRSTVSAGTAMLIAAEKIVAKGRRIAAHMMEAGEHDVEFEHGRFVVAGTDKAVDLTAVACAAFIPGRLPRDTEPGLFETGTFAGGERTYPNGCHISEVEIDGDTGLVTLVRYTAVDDVGQIINPLLVEGQLHGGIVQGVGQALMENVVYDASGQLVSASFMDYAMPRAGDFCAFMLGENEVPTRTNPLGVKGAGESGTVGALASVMNAVNDALARIGAGYLQMPATPEKVWRAMRETGWRPATVDKEAADPAAP